jgi:ribosome-binding protein aMBF1 (putative translation factor)
MTFVTILKAIFTTYHVDACYVADNMGIEDEVVEAWERGESLPTKEQLEKFSEMFAIPLSTLEKSVK